MLSLLLVGPADADLRQSMLDAGGSTNVLCAADLGDAARLLASDACPAVDVVVLAEPRGGSSSDAALDLVRRLAPLARVWRLLGTWCEGEGRSGRPPAGCLATYWHQWAARFGSELRGVSRGLRPAWALPLTATADERIAWHVEALAAAEPRAGTVAIVASSSQAAAALADLCRRGGYETVLAAEDSRLRIERAKAVVWDTTVERIVDALSVASLRGCAPGAPVVAVVGFPRAEDVERARQAGVAAVVSKPCLAGDLLWHLDRASAATS
jgi:CheY-like chemotaxis protein